MIIKLFETESEKPSVISRQQSCFQIAREAISQDLLDDLSQSISSKFDVEPIKVKWAPIPIKSKLIVHSSTYLSFSICLNPESFVYSGFEKEILERHIEYHFQSYVEIVRNSNFVSQEMSDMFDGFNKRYIYSCSCGFIKGAISRKETAAKKFLRKPVCCGSEYTFEENNSFLGS